jgi:rod shape determining protein RodA
MIIIFSYYINDQKDRINHLPTLVKIGVIYAIPLMLIVIQPDLSTTLVFIFLFCVLMFVAGLSYKIIGGVLLLAIPSIVFLFWYIQQPFQKLLKDYQVDRVMSFLHPSDYLLTTYYQQYNSIMAIGSGMLTGKGLDNNTITSVKGGDFISEPQTDFIFAVVGEELGFIGCCVVIGLLAFIVVECLIIAANARDLCGKLLASGVAAVISFQTFINIGVATGIIANTGIPLPFVSYGLSSLWSNFIGLGLILNIGLQRNRR